MKTLYWYHKSTARNGTGYPSMYPHIFQTLGNIGSTASNFGMEQSMHSMLITLLSHNHLFASCISLLISMANILILRRSKLHGNTTAHKCRQAQVLSRNGKSVGQIYPKYSIHHQILSRSSKCNQDTWIWGHSQQQAFDKVKKCSALHQP